MIVWAWFYAQWPHLYEVKWGSGAQIFSLTAARSRPQARANVNLLTGFESLRNDGGKLIKINLERLP